MDRAFLSETLYDFANHVRRIVTTFPVADIVAVRMRRNSRADLLDKARCAHCIARSNSIVNLSEQRRTGVSEKVFPLPQIRDAGCNCCLVGISVWQMLTG
jgi:hypothetical protein